MPSRNRTVLLASYAAKLTPTLCCWMTGVEEHKTWCRASWERYQLHDKRTSMNGLCRQSVSCLKIGSCRSPKAPPKALKPCRLQGFLSGIQIGIASNFHWDGFLVARINGHSSTVMYCGHLPGQVEVPHILATRIRLRRIRLADYAVIRQLSLQERPIRNDTWKRS